MRVCKLADALMADNCFEDAVQVLEAGEAIHGRNAQLQSELREARSMLREQGYFEGLNRAEEAAKLSRQSAPMQQIRGHRSLRAALAAKPGDPQVVHREGGCTGAGQAARGGADDLRSVPASSLPKMPQSSRGSRQRRRSGAQALDTCMNATGESALQSCQSALLPGERGRVRDPQAYRHLVAGANQPSAALDSYIAASLLKPGDRSIALSIVTLSESTGRRDALTLSRRAALRC